MSSEFKPAHEVDLSKPAVVNENATQSIVRESKVAKPNVASTTNARQPLKARANTTATPIVAARKPSTTTTTSRPNVTTPRQSLNSSFSSRKPAPANSRLNQSFSVRNVPPTRMHTTRPVTAPRPTTAVAPTPARDNSAKLISELNDMVAVLEAEKKKLQSEKTDMVKRMAEVNGDTETQLTGANAKLSSFRSKVEELSVCLEEAETRLARAQGELKAKLSELNVMVAQIDALEKENSTLMSSNKKLRNEKVMLEEEYQMQLSSSKMKYEQELKNTKERLEGELQQMKDQSESMLRQVKMETGRELMQLKTSLDSVSTEFQITQTNLSVKTKECNDLQEALAEARKALKMLESKRNTEEQIRRKLHNTIQELRGNIRVFCRVRPLVKDEMSQQDILRYPKPADDEEENAIEVLAEAKGLKKDEPTKHLFQYDRVFGPQSAQHEVFGEISQLVQSALDGYKVCIFAYGQTGSGKTFTMEGPPVTQMNESNRGMIPRSVEQVFQTAEQLKEKGWTFQIEASFLEVYNDVLRDLLMPDTHKELPLDIKHDTQGNTQVVNLTTVIVQQPQQVIELLRLASKNRKTAATQCNERSSRSHSVFILKINGENTITQHKTSGVLNLIDLAGSERLNNSKSQGEQLTETKHINSSLSHLGDVIAELAKSKKNDNKDFIFRRSQLTYLLKNCLGGDSKTLMFINISPVQTSVNETLCSLRFASKVNSCEIGTARRRVTATKEASNGNTSLMNISGIVIKK